MVKYAVVKHHSQEEPFVAEFGDDPANWLPNTQRLSPLFDYKRDAEKYLADMTPPYDDE